MVKNLNPDSSKGNARVKGNQYDIARANVKAKAGKTSKTLLHSGRTDAARNARMKFLLSDNPFTAANFNSRGKPNFGIGIKITGGRQGNKGK